MSKPYKDPQKWPDRIWIVRHGESAGNVARNEAEASGQHYIKMFHREVDVPLSQFGESQSAALGRWFGGMAEEEQPSVVLTSPYRRASETARIILESARLDRDRLNYVADERL